MGVFQAVIREHPGLIVVVEGHREPSPARSGRWRVFLWDWNVPHHDFAFDEFETEPDARAYAEREFLVDPAEWETCDAPGSPDTIARAIRRIYSRPLTAAEAASSALLACGFEFIDAKGRPIFPGDERCITSFNVVADMMDTLDWDRQQDGVVPAPHGDSYGFVAGVHASATAVASLPEFRHLWAAFGAEAAPGGWRRTGDEWGRPVVDLPDQGALLRTVHGLLDGEVYPSYQTGYLCASLGVGAGRQVLRRAVGCHADISEDGRDSRAIDLIPADGQIHLLLHRRRPGGRVTTYRTAVDGELRAAVTRADDRLPVEPLPLEQARDRFVEERDAWIAWGSPHAGSPAQPTALEALDIGEVQRMLMVASSSDAGLLQAVEFLRANGIFVMEAMNGAPPHVVRPLVIAALEARLG